MKSCQVRTIPAYWLLLRIMKANILAPMIRHRWLWRDVWKSDTIPFPQSFIAVVFSAVSDISTQKHSTIKMILHSPAKSIFGLAM